MSATQLGLLRRYLGDDHEDAFDDPALQDLLDQYPDDINAAAAAGWRIKAASVSEWYRAAIDGQFLDRAQVFDHCIAMATKYQDLSAGETISVLMSKDDAAPSEIESEQA